MTESLVVFDASDREVLSLSELLLFIFVQINCETTSSRMTITTTTKRESIILSVMGESGCHSRNAHIRTHTFKMVIVNYSCMGVGIDLFFTHSPFPSECE
jgi:hypothetical protein